MVGGKAVDTMHRAFLLAILAASAVWLAACADQANGGGAGARDRITAVGSSTVYPFTTLVAEQFVAANPHARAPVIESTGTGGGMKLFCAGVGAGHPDIEDASRRMKASEYAACAANGARDVLEIQVGIDGIAFAESIQGAAMALTPGDIYRALAATPGGRTNLARTWADVNPALPATPIKVFGSARHERHPRRAVRADPDPRMRSHDAGRQAPGDRRPRCARRAMHPHPRGRRVRGRGRER